MDVITVNETDTRYTLRSALQRTQAQHVLIVLPWDVEKGWMEPLDYEIVFREALEQGREVAWVVDDPIRRRIARSVGFPIMDSETEAQAYIEAHGTLPALRVPHTPQPPRRPWWAEEPQRPKLPLRRRQPLWLLSLEVVVLLAVVVVIGVTAFLSGPSAHIVLKPSGVTFSQVVPVSVDPSLDTVDLQRGVIPSRRIGDEFESYVEVGTTGRTFAFSGRATGRVLFTNLLGQEYRVPAGSIVRTSAGSYPVRFETTVEVIVPPFGQIDAPIQALEEGPRGNVGAYQINLVEGVVGFAIRVTNPDPITGAQSETVPAVSEEDRDRAWDLAAEQVMAKAYNGLQDPSYLEPGEFLPHQALVIQAVPKTAYSHLVGEQTPVLGLSLRLLVTGQAVRIQDTQAVAYRYLAAQLPQGYTLTDARFEYGEAAEEDVGPGLFTFYVSTQGYGSARIDTANVVDLVTGKPADEVTALIAQTFPLTQPPEVSVTPAWFPYIPFMPIRINIEVIHGDMSDMQLANR